MDLILNTVINEPFKAFYLGFHSVCASNALIVCLISSFKPQSTDGHQSCNAFLLLQMFRPEEVEMLVCGSPTVDMIELKKVTVYDGFSENEQIIKYVSILARDSSH